MPKNKKSAISNLKDKYHASYGDNNGGDITYFWTEIQKQQLEFVLDYESDRMTEVVIDDKTLSEFKARYKTDLEERKKDEINVAFAQALIEMVPDGHPYKTTTWGIPEQVDTLSISTCKKWYKN